MDHKLYLSDKGIYKSGNKFYFNKNNQEVNDSKLLQFLSTFKVPPAWINVWYASNPKCHIHVYGIDQGGKKQYILSEKWIKTSKSEKFNRMKSFIKNLNAFKRKIKLKSNILCRETLIQLLFNLLIDLHIRVGNEIYAEQNNTYGLTTLRQKHLTFTNNTFTLTFTGKSNIEHTVDIPYEYNVWFRQLKNNKNNKNNKKNGPLFYYYDGKIQTISSEELNVYLKENMGKEYTCKDFRTYSANMLFIKSFIKNSKKDVSPKKIILKSIDESAQQLGHTRSISRKSYISDSLLNYCLDSFPEASGCSPSDLLSKVWS